MGSRFFLLVVALVPGCLEAPAEREDVVGGPDGAPAVDGADGASAQADADVVETYFGTYSVTWIRVGGECAAPDVAADRVDVAAGSVTYWSESCPAVEAESQPVSWTGSTKMVVPPIALENCAQDTYEDLLMHSYIFEGDSFDPQASILGTRRRVSDNVPLCSFEYTIVGTKL